MANAAGTLETLALELGKALNPLAELLGPDIFVRLGVDLPSSVTGDATLISKLTAAQTKAGELETKISDLAAAIGSDNLVNIIASGVALITKISELVSKLSEVGDALHQAANALPPGDRAPIQQFAADMAALRRDLVIRSRSHRAGHRAERTLRSGKIPEVVGGSGHDRSGQDL